MHAGIEQCAMRSIHVDAQAYVSAAALGSENIIAPAPTRDIMARTGCWEERQTCAQGRLRRDICLHIPARYEKEEGLDLRERD